MKLTHVRVMKYKCIIDSGKFSVRDVTCLVGKNEAGKTALLEALEKVNSAQASRSQFDADLDFPRMEDEPAAETRKKIVVVETTWTLDPSEVAHIKSFVGGDVLTNQEFTVSRNYANELTWGLPLSQEVAIQSLIATSGVPESEQGDLGKSDTTANLIKGLKEISERTQAQGSIPD